MFNKIILFSSLLFTSLSAEIFTTNEITIVKDYVKPNTLVLFNITSTLYESSNTFSDKLWRDYFTTRVNAIITDKDIGQKLSNKIKNEIVQKIPKKPVENLTPEIVANLQKQKIAVLGITQKNMSTDYANNFDQITSNNLINVGYHLENTLSYMDIPVKKDENYTLAYGMIFTEKKPVGPPISSFIKNNHLSFAQVLMIDNSRDSLESVEKSLPEMKFTGFHYTRTDARKAGFNPTLGTIQFLSYMQDHKILSDEEATQILNKNPQVDYEAQLDAFIRKTAI